MSENSFDEKTINKIIPQIFEKKRGTLDSATITSKLQASMSQISSLATQSVIEERSSLHGIIEMVDKVNEILSSVTPKNLNRIHEVCKSTNFILDTWVNIQSQATYLNKMMKNTEYIKYLESMEKGQDPIVKRTEEITKLKTELERLKNPQHSNIGKKTGTSSSVERLQRRGGINANQRVSTVANNRAQRPDPKRLPKKNSNIPRVSSRVSRPTASSQRKTFRK